MTKATITNKNYKTILWTMLVLTFVFRIYSLLTAFNFIYLISLAFTTILFVFLLTGNKHLKLTIKIATGITLIGCGLQFLALIMRLIGQLFDKIEISSVIENVISFAIAYYIFFGSDKYIELKEERTNIEQ